MQEFRHPHRQGPRRKEVVHDLFDLETGFRHCPDLRDRVGLAHGIGIAVIISDDLVGVGNIVDMFPAPTLQPASNCAGHPGERTENRPVAQNEILVIDRNGRSSARLEHAGDFVQGCFRIWGVMNDPLAIHMIETGIGKLKRFGIGLVQRCLDSVEFAAFVGNLERGVGEVCA